MAIWDRDYVQTQQSASAFATKVYSWMTLGLVITSVVSFLIIHSGLFALLLPYWWLPTIGTFALAMAINSLLNRASFGTLAGLFMGYALLQGVFFGTVIPLYAAAAGGQVIWMAFLTAALLFGIAVFYGLVAKADLTRFSKILQVALWGLIGTTVLFLVMSFFVQMSWMVLVISYLGLVIFVGLTAYDAQAIRRLSYQVDGNSLVGAKLSLMMALKMYLNVIMIFWYLLQIFSQSSRR